MFCVASTMIKCSCRCHCSRNRGRLVRYHQDSAIDIVADTGSPVINDTQIFSIGSKIFPFEIIENLVPSYR